MRKRHDFVMDPRAKKKKGEGVRGTREDLPVMILWRRRGVVLMAGSMVF